MPARKFLPREETCDLIRAWQRHGDVRARNKVVVAHLPMVIGCVKRIGRMNEDLRQAGVFGLMQAADRFDPERGVLFSTYAISWVRAAIRDEIERSSRFGAKGARAALRGGFASTMIFLDASQRQGGDPLVEDFVDPEAMPSDEIAVARLDDEARRNILGRALLEMTPVERRVIEERYGIGGDPCTFEDIGGRVGVTRQRIQQIEKRGLSRMRQALEALEIDRAAVLG